jgi:hypothetical protein
LHNPHPTLTPYQIAAEASSGRIAFVFAHRFAEVLDMRGRLRGLARFLEYAELSGAIVRARCADLIVVREFSTFYFALFAPLLAPWLPKTVLINAHNVQAAKRSRLQALLLNVICGLGARLACLEDAEGGRSLLVGRLKRRVLCLPHPVPENGVRAPARASPRSGELVVGLVGDFRPEKGGTDFLFVLCEAIGRLPFGVRLEIGTHGTVTIPELPLRVTSRDTSSEEAYRRFLATVHLLVLPYPAATYRYRISGVLSDAFSCGTPALVTALPCFERQINTPQCGGICLSESDLADPSRVADALRAIRSDYSRFCAGVAANASSRNMSRIRQALEELRESVAGAG